MLLHQLVPDVEAAGCLDALRAKAQEVTRSALEAYAATYNDRDIAEVTNELVEQTADKMLRTYRGLEGKLAESRALAAAGWNLLRKSHASFARGLFPADRSNRWWALPHHLALILQIFSI